MRNHRRLLTTVFCALLASWAILATVIVPAVIERAYRGESLPVLNAIIEGRNENPLEYYLHEWNQLALRLTLYALGYGLAVVLIPFAVTRPAFFRKFVGEATPEALGAIRVLTCITLLITTSWEDLASVALLPAEMRQGAGMLGLLYALPIGFERLVTSASALAALQRLTELLLVLGAIGLRTRVVIPLAAAAHFLVLGILVEYSFFWHQNLVPLYLLVVLSFTPCGDGWSVDRLLKRSRGEAVPEGPAAVYGWARYLCWVVLVVPYVASGLSKLKVGGLYWWDAVNMRTNFYVDSLTAREYAWDLSAQLMFVPDGVLAVLGVITIVVEVSSVLVLFSRTARRILPVMLLMTHIGILALQRILFFDLILLQLIFYDFTGIRAAVARRIATGRRAERANGQQTV